VIDSDRLVTGVEITATEREYVALGAGASLWGNQSASRKAIGNDEVDVNKLAIQYSSDSGNGSLDQRGDDIGWMARSFLAFNTMDGAMKLSNSRQTVAFDNATSGDAQFVQGNTTNPWYIQTSPQYNMIGGEGLSLQYVTSDSTTPTSPNIIVYQNASPSTEKPFTLNDDGSITLSKDNTSTSFTVPIASYDRVFKVQKPEDAQFTITGFKSIGSDDATYTHLKKTVIYYKIDEDDATGTKEFSIEYQSSASITISPLYKVKNVEDTVITDTANDAVYSKVIELDQKGEFNYMYEVPAEKLIKDPLLGESFVNVEHPYNQFTMCQMNTDKSSVEIFNKLSSR